MQTPVADSPALPIARFALHSLIVINWVAGGAMLALLLITPNEQWIISAFKFGSGPEAHNMVLGMRWILIFAIGTIPLNHGLFKRLLAIVETVRARDPFAASNAQRLREIAWTLFTLQVASVVIGMIGGMLTTPTRPIHLNAGVSVYGWLAVLLTFLLARVFAEGAQMREELEGTV